MRCVNHAAAKAATAKSATTTPTAAPLPGRFCGRGGEDAVIDIGIGIGIGIIGGGADVRGDETGAEIGEFEIGGGGGVCTGCGTCICCICCCMCAGGGAIGGPPWGEGTSSSSAERLPAWKTSGGSDARIESSARPAPRSSEISFAQFVGSTNCPALSGATPP